MSNLYKIEAFWDQEAEVWFAESQDILGLVTEAETLDQLTHKLKRILHDLRSDRAFSLYRCFR